MSIFTISKTETVSTVYTVSADNFNHGIEQIVNGKALEGTKTTIEVIFQEEGDDLV